AQAWFQVGPGRTLSPKVEQYLPGVPTRKVVAQFPGTRRVLLRGQQEGKSAETLLLWDLAANKELASLPERFGLPNRYISSADGGYLAFRDRLDSDTLRVWDWTTKRLSGRLHGRPADALLLSGADFSPDGELLAESGARGGVGALRIWDVERGAELL